MQREIITTKDGSNSIAIPAMNVTYHSLHGAIQESMHVFIDAALLPSLNRVPQAITIFEVGFGSGLNALLTLIEAEKRQHSIHYISIDPFPLGKEYSETLNYCEQLNRPDLQPLFTQLHATKWEVKIQLTPNFSLFKSTTPLLNLPLLNKVIPASTINIIYFDAFAPSAQPELWTQDAFEKLTSLLTDTGVLVTYCSKSIVRKAMQAAGFLVEKIPGPRGKREMVRATRQGTSALSS